VGKKTPHVGRPHASRTNRSPDQRHGRTRPSQVNPGFTRTFWAVEAAACWVTWQKYGLPESWGGRAFLDVRAEEWSLLGKKGHRVGMGRILVVKVGPSVFAGPIFVPGGGGGGACGLRHHRIQGGSVGHEKNIALGQLSGTLARCTSSDRRASGILVEDYLSIGV